MTLLFTHIHTGTTELQRSVETAQEGVENSDFSSNSLYDYPQRSLIKEVQARLAFF
jgi:hypothetical protein